MSDDPLWPTLKSQLRTGDWSPYLKDLESVRRVRLLLVQEINEVNNRLSQATALAEAKEQEFRRMGPAGKAPWFEWRAQQQEWRRSALAFKTHLEKRAAEVRRVERKFLDAVDANTVGFHRDVIRRLALAIHRHHLDNDADDYVPTDIDVRLWNTLEEITIPDGGGHRSLADIIRSGFWFEKPATSDGTPTP